MTKKKMLFNRGGFFSYGTGTTTESEAFITNAGITNATQKDAIRELVNNLIGHSLWSRFEAVYPFVGGSASSHKFNLINPLDTDAAFRLNFQGTWIHSATGSKPNGTNAYANTFLKPSADMSLNNNHISYYSRTEIAQTKSIDMGVIQDPEKSSVLALMFRRSSELTAVTNLGQWTGSQLATTNTISTSKGFLINNKSSSVATDLKLIFNGVKKANASTTALYSLPSYPIYIGAINDQTTGKKRADYFSSKECAFASIGKSFTELEAYTYYLIVQLYQTNLSRQV